MHAVAPGEGAEYVQDHTQGVGADMVIECTGVPRLLQTAVDLARSGGLVQLLGFLSEPPPSTPPGGWPRRSRSSPRTHSPMTTSAAP